MRRPAARARRSFVVVVRDEFGNERRAGDDRLQVAFRDPRGGVATNAPRVSISALPAGGYDVSYVPTVSGTCSMVVTVGREHIAGSPCALTMH